MYEYNKMRYSIGPRDWIYVQCYGFLYFGKNKGRNIGRNIGKFKFFLNYWRPTIWPPTHQPTNH